MRIIVSAALPPIHSSHCNQLKKLNVSNVKNKIQYKTTDISVYKTNLVKPNDFIVGFKSSGLSR